MHKSSDPPKRARCRESTRPSVRERAQARYESEADEARVLVVSVMGSSRWSDVSSVVRNGEPQGNPRRAELAGRKPPLADAKDGGEKAKRCAGFARDQTRDRAEQVRGPLGTKGSRQAPRAHRHDDTRLGPFGRRTFTGVSVCGPGFAGPSGEARKRATRAVERLEPMSTVPATRRGT